MFFQFNFLIFMFQLVTASQTYVKQADLAFDLSLVQNSSSNAVDFHITMASKLGPKGGWVALGTGRAMTGSLMFIMYLTAEKTVSLHFGKASMNSKHVKYNSGHAQPKVRPGLPAISVFNTFFTEADGAKVEFVCYACDQWPDMDVKSSAQPFIWAKRQTKVISETSLGIHSDLGFLEIDMKQAFTDSVEQSSPNPIAETVANDMESYEILRYIRNLHGIILGASFMVFYPLGAMIVHHGNFKHAFTYHWACQLSLTGGCFITVVMGLVFSRKGVQFRDYFGTHQMLGVAVFSCLILQVLTGYLHHMNYMRLMSRTWVSYGHTWLGKLVLALGVVNTKLGLDYCGAEKETLLLWWMGLAAYVSCLSYIVFRRIMKSRGKSGGAVYTLLNV